MNNVGQAVALYTKKGNQASDEYNRLYLHQHDLHFYGKPMTSCALLRKCQGFVWQGLFNLYRSVYNKQVIASHWIALLQKISHYFVHHCSCLQHGTPQFIQPYVRLYFSHISARSQLFIINKMHYYNNNYYYSGYMKNVFAVCNVTFGL